MSQAVITSGVARWNTSERHAVRITDKADGLLDWFPIAVPHDGPSLEALWHTNWHAYPGSQWQEDLPGSWSCPVFRHGISGDSAGL